MDFEAVRRIWRELTGRADTDFVEELRAQVDACLQGAKLAHSLADGSKDTADARSEIIDIEHLGDERRSTLVEALARAIVTPIDREDLFRVSRSIDDVLDNLRDYVREVDLYRRPIEMGPFKEVTGAIVEGIERLGIAISRLADDPELVADDVTAAKKSGNEIRHRYEAALAELLDETRARPDESVREILRSRELLRRLDVVGLRLGEAADALSDGLIKRNY